MACDAGAGNIVQAPLSELDVSKIRYGGIKNREGRSDYLISAKWVAADMRLARRKDPMKLRDALRGWPPKGGQRGGGRSSPYSCVVPSARYLSSAARLLGGLFPDLAESI